MELLETNVELRFPFKALTDDRRLTVSGLEVCVRTRGSKSVVGKPRRNEKETCQENRRERHGMNDPVTDARDDFEERTFSS